MGSLGPAILSFLIASGIAAQELITSKYPRSYFLLRQSKALYGYVLIYGLLALGVVLLLDGLVAAGIVKLEGIGLSNPWIQAIAVGLSIKPFLHIRLFNVSLGSQSFPVGVETV